MNDALGPMRDASGNDRLIMTRVLRDFTGASISNNLVITFILKKESALRYIVGHGLRGRS